MTGIETKNTISSSVFSYLFFDGNCKIKVEFEWKEWTSVAHLFSIKKEAEIVVGCARKVEGAFDSELVDVIAAALQARYNLWIAFILVVVDVGCESSGSVSVENRWFIYL